MAKKMIYEHYFKENGDNIPVTQRTTGDDNNPPGINVNPPGSIQDEEQYLELSMNENQVPTIYHPQNNGAQIPSGLYPFVQQQGHTMLQPALQQQQHQQQQQQRQHQQQHLMKEQNEPFTPLRHTAHRNDADMPSQRPKFDQFITSPSKLDQRWDSLDFKTRQRLPPLIQLGWCMENMLTSAAIPMKNPSAPSLHPIENMSASPVVPFGNMYTSSDVPMGSMYTSPAVPMGNMSASSAVFIGNMSVLPDVPMGNISAFPVDPTANMSASPIDSIGNDHGILLDLNQRSCSQPLNLTDYSCKQLPIMAEKREYGDSIGEDVNITIAKRPKTDVDSDPLCTSVNNQDLSGDETGRLDSGNNKDPLSDLTNDQRVVLFTAFLCKHMFFDISDDNCAGDIDIMKIVKELENKELVEKGIPLYFIPDDKQSMIMKSYRENCLLSEIDKDFFIHVGSDKSIKTYAEMYCRHGDGSRESEEIGPITAMRLIVESHGKWLPDSLQGEVPACLINDEKEFDMFVKFWCKARNTDSITLSDQIPNEKVKNFYSAFTILSEIKNELMEIHLSKKKWSILISILMSERYSISKGIQCEEKRKNIQQTFEVLQDVKEERAEELWVQLNELEHRDELLAVDKENNKVTFVSEEIRHQVLGFFVLHCLQSKEDFKNYLNISSMDSLIEYVRPLGYRRQSTERCMYLPKETEEVFVRRFGINAICNATAGFDQLENAILSELKIPPVVLKMSQGTKRKFCNFVKGFDEEHEHLQLNRNSLLGSFLIDLNTSEKKEFFTLPLSSPKMSILCTIMLSENYTICLDGKVKDTIKKTRQTFRVFHSNATVEDDLLIKELVENDKVLTRKNVLNYVQFATDDVRHQVMSYFVRTCLVTDEDYINYIKLSSVDSLLEYICEWGYENDEEERCLHLPERMANTYVERLDVHMLCYINPKMVYQLIRDLVNKLNIPKEVLQWDYDARCRYVACAKKGTQTMHRARAMIVGCAGAGKTTLLRRLQQRSIQELQQIQSTVGLEVYDNLFEVDKDRKCLRGLEEALDTENKCLLSVVDFAGQCAYYACHQVYLSRRAFYVLVIDMSKKFDEKVDQALCEQEGTMFSDWTFGQYVIFWLKSIHTYCEDDTQVVTIGTHSDEVKNMFNRSIYDDLLELLKNEPDLKKHLDRERCFHIGFPKDDGEPLDKLTDVVECIASIALEDRWRENIPKDWAYCEVVLRQNKQSGKKCISLTDFRRQVSIKKIGKEKETFDVLRFYHDIGVILYYNEDHLKHSTITDVQWFVDCFKYIITDPKHARDLVKNDKDWTNFFKSGYLSEELLKGIWKKKKMDARKCISTLKYMQRLGLLAVGDDAHYVPCMNKLDFGEHLKCYISHLEQKTSVLVINFRFLPYFFYFRLIVACIVSTEWTIIEDNGQKCLFKNIALFKFEEHLIGVAVTTSTIQVQIFRQGNKQLIGEITRKIKKTMECILEHLTKNFHKKTLYEIGYQCSKQDVTEEDDLCFISEEKLVGRGEFSCPNHGLENYHVIKEKELLLYWKYDSDNKANQEDCTNAPVGKSPSQNYDKFTQLIDIARKSLQIYFDKIFPSKDIVSIFTKNKVDMEHGQYKFNKDQLVILFPTNGTSPSSSAFDVTIMYKLLRNYGLNVQEPLVGWGNKPEVGKKSETDDVERIRHYRNMVVHQTDKTMEQEELDIFWKDLSQAIMRLSDGTLEKEIKALKMQK